MIYIRRINTIIQELVSANTESPQHDVKHCIHIDNVKVFACLQNKLNHVYLLAT